MRRRRPTALLRRSMIVAVVAILTIAHGLFTYARAQDFDDEVLLIDPREGVLRSDVAENVAFLREVLPQAETFAFVSDQTPHFRGYAGGTDGDEGTLVGFALFTADVVPDIWGYKGRIRMLVGMDTTGTLINLRMMYHSEPFGYFSIDIPHFFEQFRNASVLDPLEVGEDIDAVSQATITVTSATRAIRQSARRMAREFLAERADKD